MACAVALAVASTALSAKGQSNPPDGQSSSSAQPRSIKPASPATAARTEPERDLDAAALARRLPLDPAIGNLRDTLPADIPEAMRQLGLHPTEGVRMDLRGRSLTTEEIVNALAH